MPLQLSSQFFLSPRPWSCFFVFVLPLPSSISESIQTDQRNVPPAHSFPQHPVSPRNSSIPLISPFFSAPFLSPWVLRVSRSPQSVIPQSDRPDVHTLSPSYPYMFPHLAPEATSGISSPGNSSSLYFTSYSWECKCAELGLCRQEPLSWPSETFLHMEP